jgi:uncharacterized protein (TIGR03032 family)
LVADGLEIESQETPMADRPPSGPPCDSDNVFSATHTSGLPQLLTNLGISLLVTTYQAGKLIAVRAAEGQIWSLMRTFDRPMGLAIKGDRLALGTRYQVWEFHNTPALAARVEPAGRHDALFVPRVSCITGDILGHEMAWVGEELWIVNTLFSCLSTLHPNYSFLPRWHPPFISALVAEDRCHLNGLAIVQGTPKYATALGTSDSIEGWRPGKASGGVLMEIPSGEVVAAGLSMPHSPRWHDDKLWVLEGGTGSLAVVDLSTGRRDTVAALDGFCRGLAFYQSFAFVGLSKIRESAMFGGIPIMSRWNELRCGIAVVDLNAGRVIELMEFQTGVEEVFAVEVLDGTRFPEVIGFQEETIRRTFLLAP